MRDIVRERCSEICCPYIVLSKRIGYSSSAILNLLSTCGECTTDYEELAKLLGSMPDLVLENINKLAAIGFVEVEHVGEKIKLTICAESIYKFLTECDDVKLFSEFAKNNPIAEKFEGTSVEFEEAGVETVDSLAADSPVEVVCRSKKQQTAIQVSEQAAEQVINTWNTSVSKCRANVHDIAGILRRLFKELSLAQIISAVEHYGKVLNDKNYFFSYKWGIKTFLSISRINKFSDGGDLWENYVSRCDKFTNPYMYHEQDSVNAYKAGKLNEYREEMRKNAYQALISRTRVV